ncbi:MAG: DoxX family protein [Chitinophagaceae bacterium]
MKLKFKKIGVYLMAIFYVFAGVNHFLHPEFYLQIIPPYFPAHETLNKLAGIAEISGGVLLIFPGTRNFAAWQIILMLLIFFTVHIYMIQKAPMQLGSLTVTPFIAWLRIPLQFILIFWAYNYTSSKKLHRIVAVQECDATKAT